MTRVVAGPFNRVEGDLEVALDLDGETVVRAEVTVPLYRGFEQILAGRPALDALVIAPRICGICSVSQSLAVARALGALAGVQAPANGLLAADIVHAIENMADHLTHFYLFFMPDFAKSDYGDRSWHEGASLRFTALKGSATAQMLPARSRLLHGIGLLAGKWPHSLALQPGGTTCAIDLGQKMRLIASLADFRHFLETTLFGLNLDDVAGLTDPAQLDGLADRACGDFGAFLRIARDLGLGRMGRFGGPYISAGAYGQTLFPAGVAETDGTVAAFDACMIGEDPAHAWMEDGSIDPAQAQTRPDAFKPGAYSWAKAPRLNTVPAEVGALARQMVAGHPLIRALVADHRGSTVLSRVVARLIELALVARAAQGWAAAIIPGQPFCVPTPALPDGSAIGLVEAARGTLGHWLGVSDGQINRYQIIAPTTWNFSPRDRLGQPGPLEQALQGLAVGPSGAKSVAIGHVVRSFDPCMVCTAH